MRIILFDAILERHVCESLERALRARGHDVRWTGPIWHGHRFAEAAADRDRLRGHVDEICRDGADVLLCLRASALEPELVARLGRSGIHTMVWLPDDPVLDEVCYRHVVGAYRTVLHCGGAQVLDFHARRHGRPTGINFPFWTDAEAFPRLHDPERADVDVVFLGNCVGPVRRARYAFLASLPFSTRIHGRVEDDPAGIAGEYVDGTRAVAAALARAKVAVNLAQWFRDYAGSAYDFPELGGLGHFQYPSRVVQYAAVGLPVVSLSDPDASDSFPEQIAAASRGECVEQLRRLLDDPDALRAAAAASHARFEASFSAGARAALLERLVAEPDSWRALDARERARLFAGDLASARPAPRRKRVLVSGYYGAQNTGDELILRAIVDGVRRIAPDLEVSVAAERPERVEADHPVSAFRRHDHAACVAEASNAAAVVVGGGGIWHDYTFVEGGGLAGLFTSGARSITGFAQLPLLARALGLDVHVFGVGVGPLVHDDARGLARSVAGLARSVVVRDDGSRRLLDGTERPAGSPIAVHPDPVFALDLAARVVPDEVEALARAGRVLGVNVRPWDAGGPALLDRLAAALRELLDRHDDLALLGIPMQGGRRRDEDALRQLFDRIDTARPKLVLPWTPRLDELLGALAACDAIVAMRLHACLLAHRLAIPVAGIAYDPKLTEHFTQVGADDRLLPLDAPTSQLVETSELVLAGDAIPRTRIGPLEDDARVAIDALARQLLAAPDRLRATASWPVAPPAPEGRYLPAVDPGRFDLAMFTALNEEYASKRVADPPSDPSQLVSRASKRAARLAGLVPLAGKTVLDLGCGRGELGLALVREHGCDVVGVDVERYAAWDENRDARLRFVQADLSATHELADGSVDVIVSYSVLEHVRRPFEMLAACRRLLRPDGRFLLIAHLYRSATGSHRSREIYFPWPHLLFDDDVFEAYYRGQNLPPRRPAWLNKLTYADYIQYFELVGFDVDREWFRHRDLDVDFFRRFEEELGKYSMFDLRMNSVEVLLRPAQGPADPVKQARRLAKRDALERTGRAAATGQPAARSALQPAPRASGTPAVDDPGWSRRFSEAIRKRFRARPR